MTNVLAVDYGLDVALMESAVRAVLTNGYVVLRQAIPEKTIAHWHSIFETGILPAAEEGRYPFRQCSLGPGRHHYTVPISGGFAAPEFYANELIYRMANHLLEPGFILATAAIAYSVPGAPRQYIHRDQPMPTRITALNAVLPPFSLTVDIPLVITDASVGGTVMVAGSHHSVSQAKTVPDNGVRVDTVPGDVVIWDSRLQHYGEANRSKINRPIVLLYYQRPWFFNFPNYEPGSQIQISAAQLLQVPERYQHLFQWSKNLFGSTSIDDFSLL